MRCGIILLAAGAGSRFGGDKLHAVIDGKTMYQTALDRIRGLVQSAYIRSEDVVVVSGDQTILNAAQMLGLMSVQNAAPMLGISRSIRLGMRALTSGKIGPASPCSMAEGLTASSYDAVMFMVCDQPYLKTETVEKMLEAWRQTPVGILRAVCGTHYGNPVIFHKDYFMALMSLYGDEGGRTVAAKHPDQVRRFEVSDELELKDIDYQSDLSGTV